MIRGMEHLSIEERLRAMGLFGVEKKRLQGHLIVAFPKGDLQESWKGAFTRARSDMARSTGFKLKEGRCR